MKLHQLREMAIGKKHIGQWYWHITTEEAARQIAQEGHLKAKEVSFEKGNWQPRPGRIYMTNDATQLSYYYHIRWKRSKKPKMMGLVRIDNDLVKEHIEPDEDEVHDIFYDATEALQWKLGRGEEDEKYIRAMKIIELLPRTMQKRAKRLLEKDYNPEQERRRGAWMKFTKEAIPLLRGTEVWDDLLEKSRSGSVQGPIPVNGVWIIDTTKKTRHTWKDMGQRIKEYERIL